MTKYLNLELNDATVNNNFKRSAAKDYPPECRLFCVMQQINHNTII